MWAALQAEVATTETPTNGHIIFNFNVQSAKIDLLRYYIQFFTGVDNLLNESYLNHLSTTRGILQLEPGRNVYLKVKFGW